ncbi:protein-disulfide reductase DsbD [Neisseriaceae bacterium ESL0693]|nr:protein-disulfide reductase DsbD [Neisseriaceae bacterium ESL0693]
MLKKLSVFLICLLVLSPLSWAIDAGKLLPANQAFVPQIVVNDHQIQVHFTIADGYYLYQQKIIAATEPAGILAAPQFMQAGQLKEDDFFGKQQVYHQKVDIHWSYLNNNQDEPYALTLSYQGCASAGVCYPPVNQTFRIKGNGVYTPPSDHSAIMQQFLTAPVSNKNQPQPAANALPLSDQLHLSRQTLWANLLAFFIAGLGLSLTACLYPLIPIVSAIVVGQKHTPNKMQTFGLSFIYVQGLALTYTLVGIITARTGALLSAWMQQPAIILVAAAILVLLALSMFDLYQIQLPSRWQSFFQQKSNRFRGGHWLSVFIMGALSALIVGPCVAPPLAFALGYIGQSGDVLLGGLALYALALGTGVPLMLIAVFGSQMLPRAGGWMLAVKYLFGCLLLAAAVYLATPFLPRWLVILAYTLLLLIPALGLLWRAHRTSGKISWLPFGIGLFLLVNGIYFTVGSLRHINTPLHHLLTLDASDQHHFGQRFTDPDQLNHTLQQLLHSQPDKPVLVDFYADWCVSCKEMAAYTFSQTKVQKTIDDKRLLQIDVTRNTPAQQAMLRQYGLYGPPGLFMIHANGQKSAPLLGFVRAEALIDWYQQNQ